MFGNIIWKLILTAMVLAWVLASLFPLNDTPFEDYIQSRVTANEEGFQELFDRAKVSKKNGEVSSIFVALRNIGQTEKIDFHDFFPELDLVYVKNLEKKNNIILKHLLHESQGKIRPGLDLNGGVSFTLEVDDGVKENAVAKTSKVTGDEGEVEEVEKPEYIRQKELEKAIEIITERVNTLGVAEPIIRAKGANSIEIQLPGVSIKDDPTVIDRVKMPARLEFRMVSMEGRPSANTPQADWPLGYEKLVKESEDRETGEIVETYYYVKQIPEATGEIIEWAGRGRGQIGGFKINLEFTSEGSKIFAEVTRRIAEEGRGRGQLAIVLDGKLYSAPSVRESISGGNAEITGDFTELEALELSNVLNNPLETPLKVTEMFEVGPSLAADARDSSIEAAKFGAVLVIAFMVIWYFASGLVAVVSVIVNLIIVMGVLAAAGATITLPGVAALVLTIGMGVDANILIFERIREELRAGKNLALAVQNGFNKAFSTIIDANVTTLITAIILIYLGTGPVKGFGVTLAIGIGSTVFCALILSRALVEIIVHGGIVKKLLGFNLFSGGTKIPFQDFRKVAFMCSWSIVLIGIATVYSHRDNIMGIDFLGGDEITLDYDSEVSVQEISAMAEEKELGEVLPIYQVMLGKTENSVLKVQTENGKSEEVYLAMKQSFPEAKLDKIGENHIGASVSKEIRWNAIAAVVVALLGILIYIAFRFEIGYGIGAVVATIHDVLMTIGIFVVLGQYAGIGSGQFTAPMVAAILMIVGYSINDTIVVFDRIREELELNTGSTLKNIINIAINLTLGRTLLTSVTTLLAAFTLFLFGAGVVSDYALVFIIGIFTGTFSSIFIASPVFYWWHKGDRRHVEEREFLPKYDWEATSKSAK